MCGRRARRAGCAQTGCGLGQGSASRAACRSPCAPRRLASAPARHPPPRRGTPPARRRICRGTYETRARVQRGGCVACHWPAPAHARRVEQQTAQRSGGQQPAATWSILPVVICSAQGLSHACHDQAFDRLLGGWLRTTVAAYPTVGETDTSRKPELIRARAATPAHVRSDHRVDSRHHSGPRGASDRPLPHHLVRRVLAGAGTHGYGGYEIDPGENA